MKQGDAVVGYVRVSTEDQGRTGYGLDAQRQAIRQECERHGWVLLRIEQDVASGRSTQKRAGLARATAACDGGEAQGLIAAKVDRVSRSVLDFAGLVERARIAGWNLAVLDLGVDLSTPMGEAMANVAITFAQLERRLISARTKDGLAVARQRGVQLGRRRGTCGLSAEVRQRAQRLRDSGLSLAAVARLMNAGDDRPVRGKVWHPTTVARALTGVVSRSRSLEGRRR